MDGGPSRRHPESGASRDGAREWRCDICDDAAFRVVGVAAVVENRFRLWLGGCCRDHEAAVRERRKAEAHELGIPEITVIQVLPPDEVAAWIQRLKRELTEQI